MGHKLFKTTPETFPVPFIAADVFDDKCLAPSPIPTSPPTDPLPPLNELTTLTPLVGRLSAIHTSAFFHLFPEEKQLELARRVAPLLAPAPGSVIFGAHGGLPQKGERDRRNSHGIHMFCHSPQSWKELWEGIFAEAGAKVEVKARLRKEIGGLSMFGTYPENTEHYHVLEWSVTRVE